MFEKKVYDSPKKGAFYDFQNKQWIVIEQNQEKQQELIERIEKFKNSDEWFEIKSSPMKIMQDWSQYETYQQNDDLYINKIKTYVSYTVFVLCTIIFYKILNH